MTTDPKHRSQGQWTHALGTSVRGLFLALRKNSRNCRNLFRKIGVIKWTTQKLRRRNYTGNRSIVVSYGTPVVTSVSCCTLNNSLFTKTKPPRRFSPRSNAARKVSSLLARFRRHLRSLELLRRQKEISKGKLSKVYEAYATAIPR